MNMTYYFAYGSNMDEEQMDYRCPDALKVCTGILHNYRFAIDSAGVATVISDPGSRVEGLVWLVSDRDIKNLDKYEGVSQNCYRKDHQTVVMKDKEKKPIEVLVYISCRPEWNLLSGTGSSYMKRILEVASHLGFREDYMRTLHKYAEGNPIRIIRKTTNSAHP